jgi:hypothetical protein
MNMKVFALVVAVCIPLFCSASSTDLHSFAYLEKAELLGKNKWITAFLAFLGGVLGLHRWYMGHYKAGLFYILCFLFTVPALQFVVRGTAFFPIIFLFLMLGYIGLEIIAQLKRAKQYFKPFQDMLLGLAFVPLGISLLWIGLILAFSGRSVYLILFTSIFTLFSLFLSFRYVTAGKREFIERFYKNRSIWH